MNLDIQNWKEFRIGDYFDIHPTKFIDGVSADDCTGHGTPLVVNSAENNGVAGLCDINPTEGGNIITFSDTTDGNTFFYQPDPFIGFAHVQGMYPKDKDINSDVMLFISTMLMFDSRGRYSYGRKMRRDVISEVMLKLPANADGKPDWQFMEDYIKSLHCKPLTTKNKNGKVLDLNTRSWREFKVKDFFKVELAKGDIKLGEVDGGDVPLVSSGETNNGIVGYIDSVGDGISEIFPPNCITIDMFGNTFYQGEPFYAVSHGRINILKPTFKLTKNIALFLSVVIGKEQYKYSYGRAVYSDEAQNMVIRLPVDSDNNPDWQFMEKYIESLPYGDRLNV